MVSLLCVFPTRGGLKEAFLLLLLLLHEQRRPPPPRSPAVLFLDARVRKRQHPLLAVIYMMDEILLLHASPHALSRRRRSL